MYFINKNNNTKKEIKDDVKKLSRVSMRMKEMGNRMGEGMIAPLMKL